MCFQVGCANFANGRDTRVHLSFGALTNLDPPGHARQRRLANAAFTPKRIAALEPFIRDLARPFRDERFRDGSADNGRDFGESYLRSRRKSSALSAAAP
jgi:cytochrome P450